MTLSLNALAGFTAEATDLIETLRRSVVLVRGRDGHGAGVVWQGRGTIITNDHVVQGDRAVVEMADGRHLEARVTARDRENDLALLSVSARGGAGDLDRPDGPRPAASRRPAGTGQLGRAAGGRGRVGRSVGGGARIPAGGLGHWGRRGSGD